MAHLFKKLFISDIMEREAENQGDDLADYFERENYDTETFRISYIDFRFCPLKL